MYFKNFGNYVSANYIEKKKIQRKMRRWAEKNCMDIVNFDEVTGDVTVELVL